MVDVPDPPPDRASAPPVAPDGSPAWHAWSSWEESADAWDQFVESGQDFYRSEFHGPALLAACQPVAGLAVLDLGCGQGWFSRALARAGAQVVGVDWSARLIGHAQRYQAETPLAVRYEVMDAAQVGQRLVGARFALVTGCMSLMDMPQPGAVLAAARTLLAPGGRVVFSVSHPMTETSYREWERDGFGRKVALKIDRYFDGRTRWMEWNMRRLRTRFRTLQFRFTLEQWSTMIAAAGLRIDTVAEPRPTLAAVEQRPELADALRVPYVLLFALSAR